MKHRDVEEAMQRHLLLLLHHVQHLHNHQLSVSAPVRQPAAQMVLFGNVKVCGSMSLSLMVHTSCIPPCHLLLLTGSSASNVFGKNSLPCPVEDMTESRMPGHSYM